MNSDVNGETLEIGLISDTHGLVRPAVFEALRGVSHLVHAGDVGKAAVLDRLGALAPMTTVRGNVDHGPWADALPLTAEIEVGGHWIHVLHVIGDLELEPRAAGFDVVVYGHSHRPQVESRRGVLFVNPGSAGPRRFQLPVTVARLRLGGGPPAIRLFEIEPSVRPWTGPEGDSREFTP